MKLPVISVSERVGWDAAQVAHAHLARSGAWSYQDLRELSNVSLSQLHMNPRSWAAACPCSRAPGSALESR